MTEKKFFCACGSIGHILQVVNRGDYVGLIEHKLGKVDCKGFRLSKEDYADFISVLESSPEGAKPLKVRGGTSVNDESAPVTESSGIRTRRRV